MTISAVQLNSINILNTPPLVRVLVFLVKLATNLTTYYYLFNTVFTNMCVTKLLQNSSSMVFVQWVIKKYIESNVP